MNEYEIDDVLQMYNQGIQLYDCFGGKVIKIERYKEEGAYYNEWYVESENFNYLYLVDIPREKITD